MHEENKTEKLITKLTRETIQDKITWEADSVPELIYKATEDFYPLFLTCQYSNNTQIGLYIRRYKSFHDEYEYTWSEKIGICIINNNGYIVWDYQEFSPALSRLLKVARDKTSGIDSLLKINF